MDTKTISLLREWAKTYNTESFIKDDPVRFPHRFTEKRDIEISAFLTAWISYGRRAHILQKAEELHRLMGESPYEFIRTGETSFAPLRNRPVRGRDTFYRFYTYHDLHLLCCIRYLRLYGRRYGRRRSLRRSYLAVATTFC